MRPVKELTDVTNKLEVLESIKQQLQVIIADITKVIQKCKSWIHETDQTTFQELHQILISKTCDYIQQFSQLANERYSKPPKSMIAEEQMTFSEIQSVEAAGLDIKASLDYKRLDEKLKEVTTCVASHTDTIESLLKDKLALKKATKKVSKQNQANEQLCAEHYEEIMAELSRASSFMSSLKDENIKLRTDLTEHIAKMEDVSEKAYRKEMVSDFVNDQQHVAELKTQIEKLNEESAQYQASLEVQETENEKLTSKLGFFPRGFLKRAKRFLKESRKSPINIFLFGLSGCGKSAVGNCILQRKCFTRIASLQQGTKPVQCDMGEYNGRTMNVFEWPDFGNDKNQLESFIKSLMPWVLEKCASDFRVTLVVLKFGDSITNEVNNLVDVLKAIFGRDTLKESGILVLTRGDIFKKSVRESFSDWLKVQDGPIKELMAACNGRALLFDNILKDTDVQGEQLQNLMSMVDDIVLDHTFVFNS
ncbi:GTPase IMAP family member 8 [Biomphalaria pfeifferi]|uniref:GTPase IMAP family member 8 n=1 Tax=Biomphalaria pfeifferi TaxID=112525 RepID=A0AAD8F1D4_BIOPF|nr:GTPase IMAP family member 8 [Biomphalaria pfeifferi]